MKVLVIGSSVCDVVINVNKIPKRGEDEHILSQSFQVGGCAFNVVSQLQFFDIPFDLFSPIGKGIYGEFVRNFFIKEEIPILIESDENNGCCYCLVDQTGERTFICEHGTEYVFQKQWFDQLNALDYKYVYICGLEIEERSGNTIIDFLEKNFHFQIIFAPSPRIHYIDHQRMQRLFALHPILHLNEEEILSYTQKQTIEEASLYLYSYTQNVIIVTLGEKGCYYYDGEHHYIQGYKVDVVNTIGAGDSHIGTIIAMLYQNKTLDECMIEANRIAAKVVGQKDARCQ